MDKGGVAVCCPVSCLASCFKNVLKRLVSIKFLRVIVVVCSWILCIITIVRNIEGKELLNKLGRLCCLWFCFDKFIPIINRVSLLPQSQDDIVVGEYCIHKTQVIELGWCFCLFTDSVTVWFFFKMRLMYTPLYL